MFVSPGPGRREIVRRQNPAVKKAVVVIGVMADYALAARCEGRRAARRARRKISRRSATSQAALLGRALRLGAGLANDGKACEAARRNE